MFASRKGRCGSGAGSFNELGEGELGRAVDSDEEVELAFCRAHLNQIDMEEADRIAVEILPLRLDSFHVRQSADAMPFKTAMLLPLGDCL